MNTSIEKRSNNQSTCQL